MSGSGIRSEAVSVSPGTIDILFDTSGWEKGSRHVNQAIMPRLFDMIRRADDCIILDMFLVNGFGGLPPQSEDAKAVTEALITALADKKRQSPDTFILFITDPINAVYAPRCPPAFEKLAAAGGCVVSTDLDQLRDSNLVYSPFYRVARPLFPLIPKLNKKILDNPFDGENTDLPKVSIAQYARLLNFKANHRKVAFIRGNDGNWEGLITSANPHTASGLHGNVGIHLQAGPISQMVRSEYLIARASILSRPEYCFGGMSAPELTREIERRLKLLPIPAPSASSNIETQASTTTVQYLTEAEIGRKVDWMLTGADEGDEVYLTMFYLADPEVIACLEAAARRGASVRILLDPNKDAFGIKKDGVPNRVIARRLLKNAEENGFDLNLRWFDTHGEQAHYKMLQIRNPVSGKEQLLVGSANFTRRNLRGYNLETAVYIQRAMDTGRQAAEFFDEMWHNRGTVRYTVGPETYVLEGLSYYCGRLKTFIGTRLGAGTY